jgi:sugar transferase (PEP-CTERM/EpsH1 system associated)
MHILFVVPYTPNLIRVRPYNLIRSLAYNGNKVTLLAVYSEESELNDLKELKKFCYQVQGFFLPRWKSYWNCVKALPSSTPLQSHFCWHPQLASRISDLVTNHNKNNPIDIVHVEHLRGVRYGLFTKTIGRVAPVVWDSVDSISLLFSQASASSTDQLKRYVTKFELSRTKKFEAQMVGRFERMLVTSIIDKEAFISYSDNTQASENINILPNGVDLEYFTPNHSIKREQNTIVISGKMSYHANIAMVIHFVESIFPIVKASIPDVNLWIVGKDPPERILAMEQDPCITVTGVVPDIRPYLQGATIAVAPLTYGAGIQNKVLEAMACGTPVVSSSQAIAAIDVLPDREIIQADDPVEFGQKVINLLNNHSLRHGIGLAGRDYIENNHQWGVIASQLEGIYHEVVC